MNNKIKIVISGGGTGGHIFPAVAIANKLKEHFPQADILFVGAKGRMEMEKVPQAGFPIKGLWISGFQREFTVDNLVFPLKLISSICKAKKIVRNFKPDVAVGTGGYASGPLLFAATRKKVPALILEQNSYPGVTNKILGKRVKTICVAYQGMEQYFPKEKIVVTGAPVRKEIFNLDVTREEGLAYFDLSKDFPVLLVVGGSQGARGINEAVAQNLDAILQTGVQLIWQTGSSSFASAGETVAHSKYKDRVKVTEFITSMDKAYAAADILISRAGAIAIAEIVAVGKPAIFIPLPSAAEDHQTKNALALTEKEAGILLKESEAKDKIVEEVATLVHSQKRRNQIIQNLKAFKNDDATGHIVKEIIKIMKLKNKQ